MTRKLTVTYYLQDGPTNLNLQFFKISQQKKISTNREHVKSNDCQDKLNQDFTDLEDCDLSWDSVNLSLFKSYPLIVSVLLLFSIGKYFYKQNKSIADRQAVKSGRHALAITFFSVCICIKCLETETVSGLANICKYIRMTAG